MDGLNELIEKTHPGETKVDEAAWKKLCTDHGADPEKGLDKAMLKKVYGEAQGDDAIKTDYDMLKEKN